MPSLRNTVGLKIYSIVVVLSLLSGIVAWINARQAGHVGHMIDEMREIYFPAYAALARTQVRSLEQSTHLRWLVIQDLESGTDRAEWDRIAALEDQKSRESATEFEIARNTIRKAISDPESFIDPVELGRLDARLDFVDEMRAEYLTVRMQLLEALEAKDEAQQRALLSSLGQRRERLDEANEAVRQDMRELFLAAANSVEAEQQRSIRYGVVLVCAALAIGSLIAGFITGDLVRPLRRLLRSAVAVQQGSLEVDLPVTSRDEVGELTSAFNQMVRELKAKAHVRETFGKYLDPRIVEGLIDRPELLATAGERRVMTVCFADLKGFTELSEGMTPAGLVKVVNHYLTTMSQPVRQNGGIIDKYIGDTIMAFWGPPFVPPGEHATLACRTALEQIAQLGPLQERLPEVLGIRRGLPKLDLRIGIATGEVVVGNIGSELSMGYTVIGETVNLASRLEGAGKIYGTRLLVNEAAAHAVANEFVLREVDSILVLGKAVPERVFEILGRSGEVAPAMEELVVRYASGLRAYRNQSWGEAEVAFLNCLDLVPEDGPSRALLARIPILSNQSLPTDWAGVWTLDSK